MHAVSDRFLGTVRTPHSIATRAVLCNPVPQFGTDPVGIELPVISGNVTINALTDIKSTLTLQVPAEYWDAVQPYGQEIFVHRGVEYTNGDCEYVPLGYHRIEQVNQDPMPRGNVSITALDRVAQVQQNKLVFPLPITDGNSHRDVFERLINGTAIPQQLTYPGVSPDGYGTYLGVHIPITWTGYDPDATTIIGDQIVQDSTFDYLKDLIWRYNATIRFLPNGEMLVYSYLIDFSTPVATLVGGPGGSLIKGKRQVKRTEVHNIVTAYGTDPMSITSFIVTFNADKASPLAWNRTEYPPFGPSPTYYSSPLLQTDGDVELAGTALLRRYQALPVTYTLDVISNPALEPNDPIDVVPWPGDTPIRAIIDSMVIPLTPDAKGQVITRIPQATEGLQLGLGVLR